MGTGDRRPPNACVILEVGESCDSVSGDLFVLQRITEVPVLPACRSPAISNVSVQDMCAGLPGPGDGAVEEVVVAAVVLVDGDLVAAGGSRGGPVSAPRAWYLSRMAPPMAPRETGLQ